MLTVNIFENQPDAFFNNVAHALMFSFFLTKPQGIDKDAIEVQSRARRNLKRIDNGGEAERRSKGKKRAAILFRMQTC